MWKFNDYCPETNLSNKHYYIDDHVYLFIVLQMNHTMDVCI